MLKSRQTVAALLKDISGAENVEETDALQADIGLDSLGLVTLLVQLEDVFHIELKESDLNPFDLIYVADVMALVSRYLEE